jgi:Ca2+-binding RTX toxin-like protein
MYTTDTSLFKMLTLLFDAAPGKYYYDAFAPLADRLGIDAVARELGNKQGLLATALGATADEQARNLVTRLGLDPDAGAGTSDDIAYNFFKGNLEQGNNPGSLVMAAIRYLEQDDLPEGLAEAGRYLSNRAEASRAISTEMGFESRDLPTLQSLIEQVGLEPDSVQIATRSVFDKLRQESVLETYTDFDDEITGTEGADRIDTGAGYDTIYGLGGADILIGGSGDDTIEGGRGQDLIEGGVGADTLKAGSFSSKNYVSAGYDSNGIYYSGYNQHTFDAWYEIIEGGGGTDKIYGGFGSDYLSGGDGNDTIYGEEKWVSIGEDEVIDPSVAGRLFNDTIYGGGGADEIWGGMGSDYIEGGDGDDELYGWYQYYYYRDDAGNDTILGGAGNDLIKGGRGADILHGGDGDDRIDAGNGNYIDIVTGGAGNDRLENLMGGDSADGGAGDDLIYYTRTDWGQHGVLIGGEGSDNITIYNSGDRVRDGATVDLREDVQMSDRLYISDYGRYDDGTRIETGVEVLGFDINTDLLNIGYFNLYQTTYWQDDAQTFRYDGDLARNYVQIVSNASTPWMTYQSDQQTPDDYGKGIFVIQGIEAADSSVTSVASVIDSYGNNAAYGNSAAHYFLVDVKDQGVGVFKFRDDTGADNRITVDELNPVAILIGVSTADITYQNADFMI